MTTNLAAPATGQPTARSAARAGVTRDSLLMLGREAGFDAVEDRASVDEWQADRVDGVLTETFACGTAAVVVPIGEAHSLRGRWTVGSAAGPVTTFLRDRLLGLQHSHAPDRHGWLYPVR